MLNRLAHDREMLGHQVRTLHRTVATQGPHHQAAGCAGLDPIEFKQPTDINYEIGFDDPIIHHREQTLPARHDAGLPTLDARAVEQFKCLRQTLRALVVETTRFHQRP
jgi:hypothetical protein